MHTQQKYKCSSAMPARQFRPFMFMFIFTSLNKLLIKLHHVYASERGPCERRVSFTIPGRSITVIFRVLPPRLFHNERCVEIRLFA